MSPANARKPWTADADQLLREIFPHVSTLEVALLMGRSPTAVHNRARSLGLNKTAERLAATRAQPGERRNPATEFRPGMTPWNKGKKGLMLGSPATWFKPGQRSGRAHHLWQPIGANRTSKEGYLQRKISDTGCTRRDYVPVHHLVWRLHGGTIPRGYALCFRDGDKRNLDINNLELVSRADLMRRNTVHNLPEPLRAVLNLKRSLTRHINRLERHP